ncbi:hypothetical protein DKX38_021600 [Salix brachista]|uniref:peroxidase n=1 Tax=Salix brachista TaxID=2182728 RepID=A0A5N5KCJ1_9ROSI|nr:hypothetical protein DKX38_021600 [Salix brachista]
MAASLIRLQFHDCFVQSEKTVIGNMNSARGYNVIEKAKPQVEKICPRVVSCKDIIVVAARDASAYKGLTARDMVALLGSHTLGQAQCFTFSERIYNHSNIDAGFASTHRRHCPRVGSDATLAPLDLVTPNSFNNNYFKNLMQNKGLLQSDQVLFNGGSTDNIIYEYNRNPTKFRSDFGSAMIKIEDIGLLTGSSRQIRRIYRAVN